jgi:hypothetical protein
VGNGKQGPRHAAQLVCHGEMMSWAERPPGSMNFWG